MAKLRAEVPPIAPADEPDIRILLGSTDDALHAGKDALDNMQSHNHDADTLARLVSEANKVVAIWQRVKAEAPAPERQITPEELSDDALTAFKEWCGTHCPNMNPADLKAARVYLNGHDGAGRGTWAPRVVRKAA